MPPRESDSKSSPDSNRGDDLGRESRGLARKLDTNTLRRLIRRLRPHVKPGALGVVMMVASSLLSLRIFWMVKDVFEPMIRQGGALAELTRVTVIVIGVVIARSLAIGAQIYFTNLVGQRLIKDLRDSVYAHLMRLSVGFFDRAKTGELMSRLTNDMNTLQVSLVSTVVEMVTAPIMIIGGIGSMFFLSWRLSLLACVGVPLIAFLIRGAGMRMNRAATLSLEKLGDLSEIMQERLAAVRVIHTFGTEAAEVASFAERNQDAFRARMREVRIRASLTPGIELLAAVGLGFALWFGGREAIGGRMDPEDIIAFVVFVQSTYSQFKKVGNVVLIIQQVSAAAARIFGILDTEPAIQDAPEAVKLPRLRGSVRFDHVHFCYDGGEPVLHDVSFEVKPGEVVALVGSSGAGKTTVASLVPRLYDVTEGGVFVDGHDVRHVEVVSLRCQLGVVLQETLLFSGTIRDNILYGRPEADASEVREAARQANAAEFIESLDKGYNTLVGERGATLSGGQRQRIAIARALLRDPRILILDEATSSLDAKSEALVQEAMEKLMQNRTTLVIAHRLSTIRNADRILVLHEGRIVEEGPHDELMRQDGHYAKLYGIQTGRTNNGGVPDRTETETGAAEETTAA